MINNTNQELFYLNSRNKHSDPIDPIKLLTINPYLEYLQKLDKNIDYCQQLRSDIDNGKLTFVSFNNEGEPVDVEFSPQTMLQIDKKQITHVILDHEGTCTWKKTTLTIKQIYIHSVDSLYEYESKCKLELYNFAKKLDLK